jgi:ferrous iron transport protein A
MTQVNTIKLSALQIGDRAVIRGIQADEAIRQRMVSMGLRAGREACIIRRGRMGGPLHIRIGSVSLVVRLKDADQVDVSLTA